jgi:hypothetical protein
LPARAKSARLVVLVRVAVNSAVAVASAIDSFRTFMAGFG